MKDKKTGKKSPSQKSKTEPAKAVDEGQKAKPIEPAIDIDVYDEAASGPTISVRKVKREPS